MATDHMGVNTQGILHHDRRIIHQPSWIKPSLTGTRECLSNKSFGEIYRVRFKVCQDQGQLYYNIGHGLCERDYTCK